MPVRVKPSSAAPTPVVIAKTVLKRADRNGDGVMSKKELDCYAVQLKREIGDLMYSIGCSDNQDGTTVLQRELAEKGKTIRMVRKLQSGFSTISAKDGKADVSQTDLERYFRSK